MIVNRPGDPADVRRSGWVAKAARRKARDEPVSPIIAAWPIATLFGFVSSAKAGVERATERHLARKRQREQARFAAMLATKAYARA